MIDDLSPQNEHEPVKEVRRYIRRNCDRPLNREVLAKVAGYSVPHLHRIFKAAMGESVAGYIRSVRMVRAAQKLRMGAVDITEVAHAAGYASHAAFSRAFKQHFGFSPSEFRELDCWTATEILREEESA